MRYQAGGSTRVVVGVFKGFVRYKSRYAAVISRTLNGTQRN
jgi:hypothetical protein